MKIIKIPQINGLGKTNGCEDAPEKILESLRNFYTNESGKIISIKNLDIEKINISGDDLIEDNYLINKESFKALKNNSRILFLGGDHSISYPSVRGFFDYCKSLEKEPCLIIFDAHPDCMKPVDSKIPTHEEWLRAIIEFGFPAENILLVGVRNSWKDELDFLKREKIRIMNMGELILDLEDKCDTIMEFAKNRELYVSFDVDFVDPVFVPGTAYHEPGGVTSRQFLYLIQRIVKMKSLRAVDIVEINPKKDIDDVSVEFGAKVLGELI
jgi:arginase family enzyme